jgi:hypothetical protein
VTRRTSLKYTYAPPDFTAMPRLGVPSDDCLKDPSRLFLFLTQWTCPYGGEEKYYGALLEGLGFAEDGIGNWVLTIDNADGSPPNTCFAAHLDTADSTPKPIARFRDDDDFVFTDGESILGADDRAGVTVLLSLCQRDVPGIYYLFSGEERGCIGSGKAATMKCLPDNVNKVICFDRKGWDDIITHQAGRRTCSDEFALALAEAMEKHGVTLAPCPNGVYTDSREFADDVPECTNIAIGYQGAHTTGECQDLGHLREVVIAALNIDWEALPIHRDPQADEYEGYGKWRGWHDDDDHWTSLDDSRYGIKTTRYAASENEDWASAISDLADDFEMGIPPDEDLIRLIVSDDVEDTITNIYLLMDKLQAKYINNRGRRDA